MHLAFVQSLNPFHILYTLHVLYREGLPFILEIFFISCVSIIQRSSSHRALGDTVEADGIELVELMQQVAGSC